MRSQPELRAVCALPASPRLVPVWGRRRLAWQGWCQWLEPGAFWGSDWHGRTNPHTPATRGQGSDATAFRPAGGSSSASPFTAAQRFPNKGGGAAGSPLTRPSWSSERAVGPAHLEQAEQSYTSLGTACGGAAPSPSTAVQAQPRAQGRVCLALQMEVTSKRGPRSSEPCCPGLARLLGSLELGHFAS